MNKRLESYVPTRTIRTIKTNRWLSDSVFVVMSMHPNTGSSNRLIYANMQRLGWNGSYNHARVAVSRARPYVHNCYPNVWALTAQGLILRNQVIHDMAEITKLQAEMAAVYIPPSTRDLYATNGEGALVCKGCGAAMGLPHLPTCTVTRPRALDTDVTTR